MTQFIKGFITAHIAIFGIATFFYLLSCFILWEWQTVDWQTVRLIEVTAFVIGLINGLDDWANYD